MTKICKLFNNFLPIVIDIETSGFDFKKNAILEVALVIIETNKNNKFKIKNKINYQIKPFRESKININNLSFIKIIPSSILRFSISEYEFIDNIYKLTQNNKKILFIGHNIFFDISFVKELIKRTNYNKTIMHDFIFIDTASISSIIYKESSLTKILTKAKINFKYNLLHSAIYDAEKTVELLCKILNDIN